MQGSIAEVKYRAGDPGKGSQQIGQQLLPVIVVFQDDPEEQVLIHLIRDLSPRDQVTVNMLSVAASAKILEHEAQVCVQFIQGKVGYPGCEVVAFSL